MGAAEVESRSFGPIASDKNGDLGHPKHQGDGHGNAVPGRTPDNVSRYENTTQTHWAARFSASEKSLVLLRGKPEKKFYMEQ